MSYHIRVRVGELVNSRGMSLRQLALKCGIEVAVMNRLANNKHRRIQFDHIEKICDVLDISDMNEILEIYYIDDESEILTEE